MNFYGLRIALLLKVDEESAVDEEGGACDVPRQVARKKHDGTRHILRSYTRITCLKNKMVYCEGLLPRRPNTVRFTVYSRFVSSDRSSLFISVAIVPGSTALHRMLYLPRAIAQLCMRDNKAAFVGV